MPESTKLWSTYHGHRFQSGTEGKTAEVCVMHDAGVAHHLMDPSRKTPETPLERRLTDTLRLLNRELLDVLDSTNADTIHFCGDHFHECLLAAAPYLAGGEVEG